MQSVKWPLRLLTAVLLGLLLLSSSVMPIHAQEVILVDLTDIYQQVSPSVVSINVVARREGSQFSGPGGDQVFGSGSGFVIDTAGHIVTNYHVVEGATEIVVNFFDGTLAQGEVVGLDPDSDLAVVRVDLPEERLSPVTFGDSDALEVGQPVIAIGSPFGERWTLTSGIVSGLERTIRGLNPGFSIGGVIQTDAAINPGNSGGPLLTMDGQVIGVNAQIATTSGVSTGVGFAIPGNLTQRVARELIANGVVSYSYLGITGSDITLGVMEAFGLPNNFRGVVVQSVPPNTPAARAGLQGAGVDGNDGTPQSLDIITAIDGVAMNSMADLISYIAQETQPGDTVTLSVLRDGTEQVELQVQLDARPTQPV